MQRFLFFNLKRYGNLADFICLCDCLENQLAYVIAILFVYVEDIPRTLAMLEESVT